MLTISGHKGNANETTLRFYLTPIRKLLSKMPPTTNVGKDVGKKEPSHTAGRNAS
jgi:hypothetical protein